MQGKKKKPFNYQLFYRRTALIVYDIISVIAASYLAILIRYDFDVSTVPAAFLLPIRHFLPIGIVIALFVVLSVPSLSQPVGICRRDRASKPCDGMSCDECGQRRRDQPVPNGGKSSSGQLLFSVFLLPADLFVCQPFFLPFFPQPQAQAAEPQKQHFCHDHRCRRGGQYDHQRNRFQQLLYNGDPLYYR